VIFFHICSLVFSGTKKALDLYELKTYKSDYDAYDTRNIDIEGKSERQDHKSDVKFYGRSKSESTAVVQKCDTAVLTDQITEDITDYYQEK
jgi:hypothetical protein